MSCPIEIDLRRSLRGFPLLLPLVLCAALAASVQAEEAPAVGVLSLADGGSVQGTLVDSPSPDVFRWQSPAFAAPLDFTRTAIHRIEWGSPAVWPKPSGAYRFELSGGDVVYGTLIGLDDQRATLDLVPFGRVEVERNRIKQIVRWKGRTDLVYSGPNGLEEWTKLPSQQPAANGLEKIFKNDTPPAPPLPTTPFSRQATTNWHEDGGRLWTDTPNATLRGDMHLPPRAMIEIELSWNKKPDFILALGVNDEPRAIYGAFRFEVWEGQLVVHRQTDTEADVAAVAAAPDGPGRAQLLIDLDQPGERLQVFSPKGQQVADLRVPGGNTQPRTGIALTNLQGDVRLERLQIRSSNGDSPREIQAERSHVQRIDETMVYGYVAEFDRATSEFVVREGGETRIPQDAVDRAFLGQPRDGPERSLRVVFQDGTRLSGEPKQIKGSLLRLSVPGLKDAVDIPTDTLRVIVATPSPEVNSSAPGQSPVLELDGVRLFGQLADGRETPEASCLVWRPAGSENAAPLRHGVSGKIVFKEPPPRPAPPLPATASGRRMLFQGGQVAVLNGVIRVQPAPGNRPGAAGLGRSLYLRSGDVIPCEITSIDERGVTFKTPLSNNTFAPHDAVKAAELTLTDRSAFRITKSKYDRLLTLPRMQKDNPPTHMIRSTNGDYLRGRLVSLDDSTLKVENHLETRSIPRSRVSQIIWLHPEALQPDQPPAEAPQNGTRVQAVRADGIRLTFNAEARSGAFLSGTSDVLGACQVKLMDVDELLIGAAIEANASTLAFQRWMLQNAPEPVAATDSDGSSGTESPLVGKPAPDFTLDLLDGKPFHLADKKGTIVILDFWATWCGPCIEAMPQVDRVAREFRDRGVELVAVNLEETPAQINEMLTRHDFHPAVALDLDGVVAGRYSATAIPQTVIIDRDGNVSRLFVGGGPTFEDRLREALTEVVKGKKAEDAAK